MWVLIIVLLSMTVTVSAKNFDTGFLSEMSVIRYINQYKLGSIQSTVHNSDITCAGG